MRLTRPPHGRLQRALARSPIQLYRLGVGGLLGRRILMLTHTGRTTGRQRQVVLEVVGHHPDGGHLVASGYGARAQWFRNIQADPAVHVQVGWRRWPATARVLAPAESGRLLADYAARHPGTAAALLRGLGHDVDGSATTYERVGSDPEHGIPLVRLLQDHHDEPRGTTEGDHPCPNDP